MELETCQNRLISLQYSMIMNVTISLISYHRWLSPTQRFKACSLCHHCQLLLLHRFQNFLMYSSGTKGTLTYVKCLWPPDLKVDPILLQYIIYTQTSQVLVNNNVNDTNLSTHPSTDRVQSQICMCTFSRKSTACHINDLTFVPTLQLL